MRLGAVFPHGQFRTVDPDAVVHLVQRLKTPDTTNSCLITGIYADAYHDDDQFQHIHQEVHDFAHEQGRQPRILVVKLGQDGHDRGSKVIATAFADLGFDVDIGPLFRTPDEAARQAIENDVHVVGVSSQAASHKTLVPQLTQALHTQRGQDILVVVGGIIPAADYEYLKAAGVSASIRTRKQHPPSGNPDPHAHTRTRKPPRHINPDPW